MTLIKTLERFVKAHSISGSESDIRGVLKKELKGSAKSVKVDKLGNLIARKGSGSPKIMLATHMDVIGLMVRYIDKNGFIRFDKVGGIDPKMLPSTTVTITGSKGPVKGVVGMKPPHIQEEEERKKAMKAKEMFIDIGASSKKDVSKAGISVGDSARMEGHFGQLLGSRVSGYGFDNRLGCLCMTEIMKSAKPKGTLYGVGTVEEETGLRGVSGPAFGINPDIVLAIDTCICGDTPEIKPDEGLPECGKGPVLTRKDAHAMMHPKIREWLEDAAKKAKIKVQTEVTSGGTTDAAVINRVREGIPSGTLSIPTRYIHSTGEVVDLEDVKKIIKLVTTALKTADKYF